MGMGQVTYYYYYHIWVNIYIIPILLLSLSILLRCISVYYHIWGNIQKQQLWLLEMGARHLTWHSSINIDYWYIKEIDIRLIVVLKYQLITQ